MKKIFFLIITCIAVTHLCYASFPINNNVHIEVVDKPIVESLLETIETNKMGILSFIFSLTSLIFLVSLFVFEDLGMFVMGGVFGFLAILFGIIGLINKKSKKLAAIGLILGFLVTISVISIIAVFAYAYGN